MRIAIDIREALQPKRAGKGLYTFQLVEELRQRGIPLLLLFAAGQQVPKQWESLPAYGFARGWKWHVHAAKWSKRTLQQDDIYISPTSYIVPWILGTKCRVVPIVHDLIAFRNEPHDSKATFIERLFLKRVLRSAYRVAVVSDTTKSDLLQKFSFMDPHTIVTIFAGPSLAKNLKIVRTDESFIFCIGTLCPRKNQLRLIQAHSKLPESLRTKYPLVLAGKSGWHDEEIIAAMNASDSIEWKCYVEDAEYAELLSRCTVFAFPSLYEGFGLPVLDAFCAGAPVLTSNVGSMKEVAQDAALLIDPESVHSISTALADILQNAEKRTELANKGTKRAEDFSWKQTVDLLLTSLNS